MNKSHSWFENNVIYRVPQNYPGAGRRVYPGFLQHTGFVAMNPDRHVTSHYDYFLDLMRGDDDSAEAHRQFYDEYNAVLDMPAEYYLDTIKTVFQDFALVNGTWVVVNGKTSWCARRTSPTTALLTIEGELDDISGAGQTRAAHDLCTGIPKARSSTTTWSAPATTASSRAAAGARWSTPRCAPSSPLHNQAAAGQGEQGQDPAAKKAHRRLSPAVMVRARARGEVPAAPRRRPRWTPRCRRRSARAAATPTAAAYAQAIAAGEAAINRCPPGGAEGIARLAASPGRPRCRWIRPAAAKVRARWP
jgi:hypothetical protein